MANGKLRVVLCWHMHQPDYRDLRTGAFILPWTYLHVIKDYTDMAAHLEAVPGAKAVVNFAPVLLEQIEDYASQVDAYLQDRIAITDPLLAALAEPAIPGDPENRMRLLKECLRLNRERQVNRYGAYEKLTVMAEWLEQNHHALVYVGSQFFCDLLVWYHLAWMGETVKLSDQRVQHLIEKRGDYTLQDRLELLHIIGEQLTHVLGRYKALAHQGRVELSVTPYAHPIMPLMLDLNSAHEAMPEAALPELETYPGGEDRVKWHLDKALAVFKRFFGFTPAGCWPSEGSISERALQLLGESGFKWTASGGSVLHNSLSLPENAPAQQFHHPFRLVNTAPACFFRDDGLSDLIGFQYSKWHAEDAVRDLISHLEAIAAHESEDAVVSIILDGENAWEYFPHNGYHFLSALYRQLASHPALVLTTFSECLDANVEVKPLNKLVAGSWVYGTFSTWIGDADKNRGWDMLGDAKKTFDAVLASGRLTEEEIKAAQLQLAICEGSDWFWWFGDYNPGEAVSSFEKQFRLNLANLYHLLGQEPPAYLSLSFTQGFGDPVMGGAMRPGLKTD